MTKKHSTKKALIASVLALCLCLTSLIGTTYAWFTDSVSSANNVIKSGNLDVVLEYKTNWEDDWTEVDGSSPIFDENALYEPGYTEVVYLRIANAGSLALKYTLTIDVVSETPSVNVYGDEFKLSEFLKIGSYTQDEYSSGFNYADILMPAQFGTREAALNSIGELKPFSSVAEPITKNSPLLPSGDASSKVTAIVINMPETVGNEANYDTNYAAPEINFGVTVLATQYTSEKDSFGSDYDKDADASVFVSTPAELKAAILAGESVTLTEDLTLTEAVTFTEPVDINLGGNTLATNGLTFENGGSLVNGSIESAEPTLYVPHFSVANGDFLIENVTVVIDDYLNTASNYREYTGFDCTNANVVMNNCNVIAKNPAYIANSYVYAITANNSTIVMNGGSITATASGTHPQGTNLQTAISAMGTSTVTLNNVDITATSLGTTMGHLIIYTTDRSFTAADFVSFGGTFELHYID